MAWTEKLKSKWGLKSTFQVLIVLVVFALTGTTVLFLKEPLFSAMGLTDKWSSTTQMMVYLITVVPLYQLLLLIYAALLGQFSFFWEYEKRTFRRISGLWSGSRSA